MAWINVYTLTNKTPWEFPFSMYMYNIHVHVMRIPGYYYDVIKLTNI